MTSTLILRQEAERELSEAYRWYEARVPGLGAQFLGVVEHTLNSIQDNPMRFPVVNRDAPPGIGASLPLWNFLRLGKGHDNGVVCHA
jgi:hypothetical protein